MRNWLLPIGLGLSCLMADPASRADSNINTGQAEAWGANVGWINWRPDSVSGATIGQFVCSGYLYSANVGWISLGNGAPANGFAYQNNSASDFGVNADETGNLRGLAYGANVGWISFEPLGAPRVDLSTGRLSGAAYGANIGWISLGDPNSFVAVDSISAGADSDGDGIPDAWEMFYAGNLTTFTATSDYDGDGATDLQEYLAGTNPLDPTDSFHIVSLVVSEDRISVSLSWTAKLTRQYRVLTRPTLASTNSWVDSGLGLISPDGTVLTRSIPLSGRDSFYQVEAVRPLGP
jgi:hypothetical protein